MSHVKYNLNKKHFVLNQYFILTYLPNIITSDYIG